MDIITNYIDITQTIGEDTVEWPSAEPVKFYENIRNNPYSADTGISMNLHSATHLDAPRHFIENGKLVSELPIRPLIGRIQIIEQLNTPFIPPSVVKHITTPRVLFKTRSRTPLKFDSNYTYIPPETAKLLVEHNISVVATDCPSIEKFGLNTFESHRILLTNEVYIIESVDSSKISAGMYHMIALPMKIAAEAAPIRIIVRPIGFS